MAKGPGTILKELYKKFHINTREGCGCHSLAREMDKLGPEKCREQLERIVDRMEQTSKKWIQIVKEDGGNRIEKVLPKPPRLLLKQLALWAINQSIPEETDAKV